MTRRPTEREKFIGLVDLLIRAARDAEINKLNGHSSGQMRLAGELALNEARQRLLTELGVYP